MNIECPTCKRLTIYSDSNPNRPFCSDRCRVIDTAAWASESYSLASEEFGDVDSSLRNDSEYKV